MGRPSKSVSVALRADAPTEAHGLDSCASPLRLSFQVPGAPVPCQRARVYSRNGKITSSVPARTRNYERLIGNVAIMAKPAGWPMQASYRVRIAVYREARRGDLDNFVKSATDALNRILWDDDRRIVELHGLMFDDKAAPRLFVEVEAS